MKTFTIEQLKTDWCKVCVYHDMCNKIDDRYCDTMIYDKEHIEFLGKVLYGEDVIYKEN